MKYLRDIFVCAIMVAQLCVVGCQKSDDGIPAKVPNKVVSYYTVDGVWQLVEWNGGPLAEGTLLYIDLDRKEHRFEMWDNFASMYPTMRSGYFLLSVDDMDRDIISGWYDYGIGDWSNDYIVELNVEGDGMVWRSVSSGEVMVFAEVEQLPDFKQ